MTLRALQEFVKRSVEPSADRCGMCAQPAGDDHSHVVNLETRQLVCTCRPCYLLFTQRGAARGKLRAVPERYRVASRFRLDDATWERLQIPVRTAFFFRNSLAGKFVAFYPSPAGATESLLGLDAWRDVHHANPVLATLEPDVEALLVHGGRGSGRFQCFLVPIDACYELVGRVRRSWRGFDGGDEAWRDIDDFFAALRERSEEVGEAAAP